jgi:methylated-DNA-protein-cysteine methyltransferase-like protein
MSMTTSTPSHASIHARIRLIPHGHVVSYGDISKSLGYPSHARYIGRVLALLPPHLSSPTLPQARAGVEEVLGEPEENGEFVPWHRVVSGGGVISARGSVGAVRRQEDYLRAEGVEVSPIRDPLEGREEGRWEEMGGDERRWC